MIHYVCLISSLLLHDTAPKAELVRSALEKAPLYSLYSVDSSGIAKRAAELRMIGVSSADDLLPFIEERTGRAADMALKVVKEFTPVSDSVLSRIRTVLPTLSMDGQVAGVRLMLSNSSSPRDLALAILPDLGLSGIHAVMQQLGKDADVDLGRACLARAREVVRDQSVDIWLAVFAKLADPPGRWSAPEYSQGMLDLFLEAAEYPDHMDDLSVNATYRFLFSKGVKTDALAVETRLKELLRKPDPLPGIVAWQTFLNKAQDSELGLRLLSDLRAIRPDLRPLVDALKATRFEPKGSPFGTGEAEKMVQNLFRERYKLPWAREKERSVKQAP